MNRRLSTQFRIVFALIATVLLGLPGTAQAQVGLNYQIRQEVKTIQMVEGSSQRLQFDYNIPELMVENPEVIGATPVTPNTILLSALKPGMSTLTVSDPDKNLEMINIEVSIDVREVEGAIAKIFPDSQVSVNPLKSSIILTGNVARADQVENILKVARDYFPANVINELQVNGTQNIAIKVKVYEVARGKLRKLGVDWGYFGEEFNVVSSVAQLIQDVSTGDTAGTSANFAFGVLNDGKRFNAFIEALESNNLAKLLDQPVLVAQNGRPAEFLSGGEIAIPVASGLGTNAIEYRPFGTKLDVVPIIHGQGKLTLEIRAEVSEVAADLAGDAGVPGFRVRRVNTGVKMKAGHTLALAGDYREKDETEVRGIPKLMDNPWFGPAFRSVSDKSNETELVFLLTPNFISEVEQDQLPDYGPGRLTTRPSDRELYINGYTEVPRCEDDCPVIDSFGSTQARGNFPFMTPHSSTQTKPATNSPFQLKTIANQTTGPTTAKTKSQPERESKSIFKWPFKTKVR